MIQIQVRCACGHIVVASADLDDSRYMRPYRAIVPSTRACPDCSRSMQHEVQSGEHTRSGLVPLVGSTYQVVWAMDIREEHMRKFREMIGNFPFEQQTVMEDEMVRLVNQQPTARFWIDNSANTFRPFMPVCNQTIRRIIIRATFATYTSDSQGQAETSLDKQIV